jgi:FtsZ-binding cell division protein ZapB
VQKLTEENKDLKKKQEELEREIALLAYDYAGLQIMCRELREKNSELHEQLKRFEADI